MNRAELIENLSQDILTYVMHGGFPEHHVAAELRHEGLDERFDDYESLVGLHFVLRPDIVEFVEDLPAYLRSIKTQTENVSATSRLGVDGRINWNATIRERYRRNPYDTALFVYDDRTENYDIDENVVLKRLISIIYHTLRDCREYLEMEYEWVTDRWRENLELVDRMYDVFERNVHVTRIRDPKEYEPTDRMVVAAEESRSEVYRRAATLVREYEDAMAGDTDAIRDLLEKTVITPDDEETLLELYVLFRYVESIESIEGDEFTLRTIESGSQEVARLGNDDREIVLYHDSSGNDLSFVSDVFEKQPSSLSRTESVQREARKVAEQYFVDREFRTTTGRPDVIVLEIKDEERREYLITEIKSSKRVETVTQGIRETLEYLAFLRDEDEYVYDEPQAFGSGWNGVLVTQDFEERETAPLSGQRSIRILQASEVANKLTDVLREVIQ